MRSKRNELPKVAGVMRHRLSVCVCVCVFSCAFGASGCDTRHHPVPAPTTTQTAEPAAATASGGVTTSVPQNLPVIETYSGLLPCADCMGIRVHLTFFGKRGVVASRLHEGDVGAPDGDKTIESEGKAATVSGYEANPTATVYALNPGDAEHARYFLRVDDSHLRLLSASKQEIASRLNYTLTRDLPTELPSVPAGDAPP